MITPLLKINPTFKDLIPPLSKEELEGLEKNILANGCEQPIKLWQGYIVDGHNRYEICMRHKLSCHLEEREFESQNDVEIWIIENQFNRRNLPSFTRATLTFELEKRYKTKRGENQYTKESGSVRIRTEAPRGTNKEPLRKAARAAGMGHDTYARCKFIDEHADEKTKEALHKGEKTTNEVYVGLKREKRKKSNETLSNRPSFLRGNTASSMQTLHGSMGRQKDPVVEMPKINIQR